MIRKTLTVWLASLPLLYVALNGGASLLVFNHFLESWVLCYTILSYISFNLEVARGNVAKKYLNSPFLLLQRMFFYTFYQPYLFALVVLYPDFEFAQRKKNTNSSRKWGTVCFFALRIAFWWILLEVVLHFFYLNLITFDYEFATSLPKDELISVVLALGGIFLSAFFHLYYVVIFGLPSVFALLDGMEPKEGPICIYRVSLYSNIWRAFDRGLYAFFKSYIFVPICAPTFSLMRKMFGIFVSCTFVLIWHGFANATIVWSLLNIAELFVEIGAKEFYSIPQIRLVREQLLTDVNFRRLLGLLHVIPFLLALFSNILFLGGQRIFWLLAERILLEEAFPMRWRFLLIIFAAYFFAQLTIELDRWEQLRLKTKNSSPSTSCPLSFQTMNTDCDGLSAAMADKTKTD